MRISTRGRYALRILMDLAQNRSETPRMISDICKSQGLSRKYIGRLIIPLCKAGLVVSKRGAKGGYFLKKDPKKITLLNIVEIMEGPMSIVSCITCPRHCKRADECVARETWMEVNDGVKAALAGITLQQILEHLIGQEPSACCKI